MATVVSSSEMEGKVMLCCVWLVKPGEGVLRAKFEKTLSPCTKRPCEHRSWRACPSVWPFLLRACSRGEDPYERLETMETLSDLQQQIRTSAEEHTCVISSRSREARDVSACSWLRGRSTESMQSKLKDPPQRPKESSLWATTMAGTKARCSKHKGGWITQKV